MASVSKFTQLVASTPLKPILLSSVSQNLTVGFSSIAANVLKVSRSSPSLLGRTTPLTPTEQENRNKPSSRAAASNAGNPERGVLLSLSASIEDDSGLDDQVGKAFAAGSSVAGSPFGHAINISPAIDVERERDVPVGRSRSGSMADEEDADVLNGEEIGSIAYPDASSVEHDSNEPPASVTPDRTPSPEDEEAPVLVSVSSAPTLKNREERATPSPLLQTSRSLSERAFRTPSPFVQERVGGDALVPVYSAPALLFARDRPENSSPVLQMSRSLSRSLFRTPSPFEVEANVNAEGDVNEAPAIVSVSSAPNLRADKDPRGSSPILQMSRSLSERAFRNSAPLVERGEVNSSGRSSPAVSEYVSGDSDADDESLDAEYVRTYAPLVKARVAMKDPQCNLFEVQLMLINGLKADGIHPRTKAECLSELLAVIEKRRDLSMNGQLPFPIAPAKKPSKDALEHKSEISPVPAGLTLSSPVGCPKERVMKKILRFFENGEHEEVVAHGKLAMTLEDIDPPFIAEVGFYYAFSSYMIEKSSSRARKKIQPVVDYCKTNSNDDLLGRVNAFLGIIEKDTTVAWGYLNSALRTIKDPLIKAEVLFHCALILENKDSPPVSQIVSILMNALKELDALPDSKRKNQMLGDIHLSLCPHLTWAKAQDLLLKIKDPFLRGEVLFRYAQLLENENTGIHVEKIIFLLNNALEALQESPDSINRNQLKTDLHLSMSMYCQEWSQTKAHLLEALSYDHRDFRLIMDVLEAFMISIEGNEGVILGNPSSEMDILASIV